MAHDNPRSDDVHATVSRRLRAAAMRYSRSRRAVVDVLAEAGRPLTLPEILMVGTDHDLAQSSAYRNLAELVEVGVVRRLASGDDHGRFELHESLTGHHHHLVCMVCGGVEDFEAPEEFEAGINTLVETAAQQGFVVDGHLFDMVGRCATCS